MKKKFDLGFFVFENGIEYAKVSIDENFVVHCKISYLRKARVIRYRSLYTAQRFLEKHVDRSLKFITT